MNFHGITEEIDPKSDAKQEIFRIDESKGSENIQSTTYKAETNRSPDQIRKGIKSGSALDRDADKNSSENISGVNSEGKIDHCRENISSSSNTGDRMAQVLTLGAGGDNQAHVTRPKTAKV